MATFILLSEPLVTGLRSDTEGWFNFTTRPGIKRMLVLHSSLLNAALKGLWIKSVFLCLARGKVYLLLNCVPGLGHCPVAFTKSDVKVIFMNNLTRDEEVTTGSDNLGLPIWNLVRLVKLGIMLLRKWQVYVKQISRYRFRRSNLDLIINRHRGHRAI